MANIRKIEGKTGVSYKITVTRGRDSTGKQLRHYMTFSPPAGMGEKRALREAQKAAFAFEQSIEQGFQLDNRQTFREYAAYCWTSNASRDAKSARWNAMKSF